MRVVIRPTLSPDRDLDLTRPLIAAIANELSRAHGGNDVLNWLEAERVLQRLIGEPEEREDDPASWEAVGPGGSSAAADRVGETMRLIASGERGEGMRRDREG
ncbi:MAG TPA: hypothetical protein VNN12_06180 [Dehalococcoidia bacterium]|nr:hypothetical protein [Dehalococcoidia bacterium]